ncbi:hypothetical protein BpHYR1_046330 [Brachionus plicatilis]|uniref:Uncharacterized protein n=1 Tax=Brachionus plicatilis TaxID=10195 RepID=A0A3M7QG30_BRAPC|nr:hypothetical protein BpHYR1_046330 [Brachionus plicatilis]
MEQSFNESRSFEKKGPVHQIAYVVPGGKNKRLGTSFEKQSVSIAVNEQRRVKFSLKIGLGGVAAHTRVQGRVLAACESIEFVVKAGAVVGNGRMSCHCVTLSMQTARIGSANVGTDLALFSTVAFGTFTFVFVIGQVDALGGVGARLRCTW